MQFPTTTSQRQKNLHLTARLLSEAIRLLCIFLMCYTAFAKLGEHARFVFDLQSVSLVRPYALALSWAVPAIELAIAAMMLLEATARKGLYAFLGLMGIFTIYIACMLIWIPKLPCSCGGAVSKLSWTQHIWFNLAFMALASLALCLEKFIQKSKIT